MGKTHILDEVLGQGSKLSLLKKRILPSQVSGDWPGGSQPGLAESQGRPSEPGQLGQIITCFSSKSRHNSDFSAKVPGYRAGSDHDFFNDFSLAYTIPEFMREHYQSILINIPFNNAGLSYHNATEASWRLPLPAVFVIDRTNTITFAEAHADFRVRPEPADVLATLDSTALKNPNS